MMPVLMTRGGSLTPGASCRGRRRSRSAEPPREKEPERPPKLHVGNLTRNVTSEHIKEVRGSRARRCARNLSLPPSHRDLARDPPQIFSHFGEIFAVDFPTEPRSGLPKGHAFVEFKTRSEAEKAIDFMHEAEIDGARVTVQFVLLPRRQPRPRSPLRGPPMRRGPYGGRGGYGGPRYPSPPRRYPSPPRRFPSPPRHGYPPRGRSPPRGPPRGRYPGPPMRGRSPPRRPYSPRGRSPPRRRSYSRSPSRSPRGRSPLRRRSYSRSRSRSRTRSYPRSPTRSYPRRGCRAAALALPPRRNACPTLWRMRTLV